ncbi:conserved hypothetical protein [delta proteobacterium NaphS2]|nr:conserved hypothetical protein [delta proteobacterium NaphS2]
MILCVFLVLDMNHHMDSGRKRFQAVQDIFGVNVSLYAHV